MTPFTYMRVPDLQTALESGARHHSDQMDELGSDFFAGGTDIIQLMQEGVRNPGRIVDITPLTQLYQITVEASGIKLGALIKMSDAAQAPELVTHFPVVVEALLASASPQVRNLATLGGNLLQRTRCGYFRDVTNPCNKREPGTGCPALDGQNRMMAIFGTSEQCIATYAGDFANALLILDAEVEILGLKGRRTIPLADLHAEPGTTPHIETSLEPGELITAIWIPFSDAGRKSHYLKVRDRASFEFAVASAAVALYIGIDRDVKDARVAVAGVATKPWRLPKVEQMLKGRVFDEALCNQAGAIASEGARLRGNNSYKATLIERTVARALKEVGATS